MKARYEIGNQSVPPSPHAHRVCDSTIKNSSILLRLLRALADTLQTSAPALVGEYGISDTRRLLFGKWPEAVSLLRRGGDTPDAHSRLLKTRVDWLAGCNNQASRAWMTAHVRIYLWLASGHPAPDPPTAVHPRPGLCNTTNLLPDPRKYLMGVPLFQVSAFKSPSSGKCKLTHLLNKCLPKRCQIRELTRFLSEYCVGDRIVRSCFERMMFCSLAGVYAHCVASAPFGILVSLATTLLYQPGRKNCMIPWMQTREKGEMSRIQYVCLHVVREYLCVCVCTQPTLRHQLCRYFNWNSFEEHTFVTMQHLRGLLYSQCAPDRFDLSGMRILSVFSQTLHRLHHRESPPMNKTHHTLTMQTLLRLFCKLRTSQLNLLSTHATLTLEGLCADVIGRSKRCTAVGIVARVAELCADSVALEIMKSIIRCIHCNTTDVLITNLLRKLLHRDIVHYTLLEYETREISEQMTTRVYRLDARTRDTQRAVVATHLGTKAEPPFQSNLFYCRSCDTVANSCARPRMRATKRTQSHLMSVKTVVDDDNGLLLCAENNKQSINHTANIRTITFDNCMSSVRCRQQEMLILPIIGKLVQVKDGIYCLCVTCGRVTKLGSGLRLTCHTCELERAEVCTTCFMCDKSASQTQTILCFAIHIHNLFEATNLCQSCITYVCKQTRHAQTGAQPCTALITRKQLTRMQKALTCRRQLAIPGERFDFFQSPHRRK